MKRNTLLLICILVTGIISAQDSYFKTDAGIGAAMTFGNLRSYGISVSTEPKVFITPQISAGIRLEGDVLFGGSVQSSSSFSVGMSSRTATLLKGEYYLSEEENRLFVGLMAGRYAQANIGSGSGGGASITAGRYFGFAPEVGVTFNDNFRISAMYHVVPGSDLVSVSSGETVSVSRNYFVIQLGFQAFRFDF